MRTTIKTIQPERPPLNQLMLDGALAIARTIETLTQRGFTVIGIDYNCGARPTIQIQNDARCRQLIDSDEAVYYSFGRDTGGHFRIGQFHLDACRVLWTERGH